MEAVCGFFGLHPWELPWDIQDAPEAYAGFHGQLTKALASLTAEQGITRFLVSMDGGAALLAAEGVLALRTRYPVTLECVIPYEELHTRWPEPVRERYFSILERCDGERMISCGFSLTCYRRCARYLTETCGTLLILWNGRPCDAGDALTMAERRGRRVHLLSPAGDPGD